MKIIKPTPSAGKAVRKAVVAAFLYRDADIFKNTPLQFLKNNPNLFNPPSGLIA
ncbi:hypothetical protein ABZR88_21395 [Mucilaginibacter yixingensis]|uniref:hypothetical protein n=1 Tax=Mucilaginibacter yixingensis TaxID=1295612 RepID=UPI0014742246|nr:hypothetical protein [Mucilaginibacter yixingensis]